MSDWVMMRSPTTQRTRSTTSAVASVARNIHIGFRTNSIGYVAVRMIEAHALTKHYGPRVALDDVGFTVEKGEIVGFLGPNGAGKTTTMRILTGFLPASGGDARVAGFDVFEEPMEVKR